MKCLNRFALAFTLGAFACGGGTSGTITNPATPSSPARVMSLNISGAPESPAAVFPLTANAALSDGTTRDVTRDTA